MLQDRSNRFDRREPDQERRSCEELEAQAGAQFRVLAMRKLREIVSAATELRVSAGEAA